MTFSFRQRKSPTFFYKADNLVLNDIFRVLPPPLFVMEKYVSVGVQKAKMIQEVDSFQDHHNELEEEKKMDRSKAISILDVKWSTFCSLVHSKKKQEVNQTILRLQVLKNIYCRHVYY